MPFTDNNPLEYYYMHGYHIMNPICRKFADNPQYLEVYKFVLGVNPGDEMLVNSVTTDTMNYLKNYASSGWGFLGIDEVQERTILTGDASHERRLYLEAGVNESDLAPEATFRKSTRDYVSNQIRSLWELCVDCKRELLTKPPATGKWVIRGDGSGGASYFSTQGANFTPHSPTWTRFERNWKTNQFFSTSDGNELASVAGKAVVWLIRIKQAATQGREGGLYTSESEILFPYGVSMQFEGGVTVSSANHIDDMQLNFFKEPEEVRAKMKAVYNANSFPGGKARFLIASEL